MENNNNNNNHKSKYEEIIKNIPEEKLKNWTNIQETLKLKLIDYDDHSWELNSSDPSKKLNLIGGMDISCSKKNPSVAIVALVVVDYDLNIIYEKYEFADITEPYVPGFLAFREIEHYEKLINDVKKTDPDKIPEVLMIDGNGIYHQKGFGCACHIGVITGIPTLGCSKTVLFVDGITKTKVRNISNKFVNKGEYKELIGDSGKVWGAAIKSTDESFVPMIISQGHKMSLKTSIDLFNHTTKFRVPEPIRLADKMSRRLIEEYEKEGFKKFDIEDYLNKNKTKLHYELTDI